MRRRILSINIVIVLTIVAAVYSPGVANAAATKRAISPQARGTAPAGGADPCALLKKEDAAGALGGTVSDGKLSGSSAAGVSACEYTGSGYLKIQLILRRFTADQAAVYKGLCAEKGKEGLSSLGEVACWYDNKHEELQVLIGTNFFSIELRGKSNPTDAIKAAAQKVYERLK